MTTLTEISNVVAGLIRSGAILRFIYCMIRLQSADTEKDMYTKRAKNTVFFMIIAECAWVIKDVAVHYYN